MKALIQFDLEVCKRLAKEELIMHKVLQVDKLPKEPIVLSLSKSKSNKLPFVHWDDKHRYGTGTGLIQYVQYGKYKLFDVIMSVPE